MKHIKLYRTKEQAIGQVIETPAIIMANTQTAFAPQSLGEKIELSQDENGGIIVSIYEEELPVGVVDLGLPSGLKWASCNVGASRPCDPGLLFQFGRVDGYYNNPDLNHNFYIGTNIPTTTSGTVYNAGDILNKDDDAAYFATNGKLRMPTAAEIDELLANTTSKYCMCLELDSEHTHTDYYTNGRLFTSKTDESKKIFIPCAGAFIGATGSFNTSTTEGSIWSSSISSDNVGNAYDLTFGYNNCIRTSHIRFLGLSVRGVCK